MSVSFKNLRNLGYNYAESLAELVDNSIKAKAKNVEIYFYYTDDPFILTIDDGHGMDKNEIENKALVAPKGDNVYVDSGPNDLGRFGMGLKQGTFAQCKMLTVFSKKNTLVHKSINLNEEEEISDFLPQCVSHKFIKEKIKNLENSNSGTAILWSNLDKLLKERDENNLNFYPEIEKVKKHFKMIYHKRIINNKIKIFFQGRERNHQLKSVDPFYTLHRETIKFEDMIINLKGTKIIIRPWVIPKEIPPENFNKNGNELQGFYFSNKDRIIDFGGWFEIDNESKIKLSTTDKFNRLRVLVELPGKNIKDWISSTKSKVNIPDFFKKSMLQIVNKIRANYIVKIK